MTNIDKEYSIKKLLLAKRYITLLDTVSFHSDNVPAELIAEILEKAITTKSDEDTNRIDPHNAAELFIALDKAKYKDSNNLIKLEWLYIEVLSDDIWGRPPKLLHKDMSINPKSFVDVIKMMFKPTDNEVTQTEEAENYSEIQLVNRFKAAYNLLKSFTTIPGTMEDGKIDYEILLKWVKDVIKFSIINKREYYGYYYIGDYFAKGIEKDSIPPPEVCQVIEEIKNGDLEHGFQIANANRRGVTTRGMFEGGIQEKHLADHYYKLSKTLEVNYPRTSEIYKQIAKKYEYYSLREDDRAKEEELEY